MPITLGNITYTAFANGLAVNYLKTPWRTSVPTKIYPVPNNSSMWFMEEEYMILKEFYVMPPTTFRHPTESSTFWIKDSRPTEVGPGVQKFIRTWALLPGATDKGYVYTTRGSFNFSVPAVNASNKVMLQFPTPSGGYNTADGRTVITAQLGSGDFSTLDSIEVGKPAKIAYYLTDPKTGATQLKDVVKTALAVTSNTLTVERITDNGAIRFVNIQRADVNQPSYVKTVSSKVETSYWIVGVNCSSVDDIPIINQYELIESATGGRVQYLSDDTYPSLTDWYGYIENKEWICVESSVIQEWEGSIYSKTERYVRATL